MKVVYLRACEWEGLYINGLLAFQNHTIDARDVLHALKPELKSTCNIEIRDASEDEEEVLMQQGTFPSTLK